MSSRATLFKKSKNRNYEFERYLTSSESNSDIVLDCTGTGYVMTLPLSYFVTKKPTTTTTTTSREPEPTTAIKSCRSKGKADTMPYESFRIINAQHRGGHAHSLVLIKSRAIQANPHHLAIFEPNGRNKYCSVRIIDDHDHAKKNVTKDYTTISPEYNINYGTNTHNPGYCGIYSIICVVAFRHYRSNTGLKWLAEWNKLLAHMSQRISTNAGSMGVTLAACVQEIIATTPDHPSAEKEIAAAIRACLSVKQ